MIRYLVIFAAFSLGYSQQGTGRKITETLYFRLAIDGIRPAQITINPGRYLIQFDNGMVSDDLNIVLDGEGDRRIASAALNRRSSRLRRVVELAPGRHWLSIQRYPKWRAEIVVRPAGMR